MTQQPGGNAATQTEPLSVYTGGNAITQPEPRPVYTDGAIVPGTTIGGPVGVFYTDFTLWNPERTRSRTLNGLVDTGSSYAMIPANIMAELGIAPEQTKWFILANGDTQDYPVGRCDIELQGHVENVHIVFGPENRVLLGSMALEAFALAVDAKNHRLIPADLFL